MGLLYANPLKLAFHYLLLYFSGESLDNLHSMFMHAVQQDSLAGLQVKSTAESHQDVFDFIVGTEAPVVFILGVSVSVREKGLLEEIRFLEFHMPVGSGSAGSVLANRLSEENNSVLLLEAGGEPFPLTTVPALSRPLQNHPNIDWCDQAVPQKHAFQAFLNKGPKINHGKVLGGSSTVNYMIAMRGHPNDFNNWAEEANDSSWSYVSVLPFFRKMENYHGSFPNGTFHSVEGPLYISKQEYAPMLHEWLEAGKELGYAILDPNEEQKESFFPLDLTTKDGKRFSTHTAYILPAINRPNLHVKTYSHATKIHFDSNNRAEGVAYSHQSQQNYASAAKEVIVSAGAIGSPQLLMLSGIGPEEQLKEHGIRLLLNLPVGQNFHDHIFTCIGPFTVDNGNSFNAERDLNINSVHRYIASGEGPLSTMTMMGGAIRSSSIAVQGWPDIYVVNIVSSVTESVVRFFEETLRVRPGIIQEYFAKDWGKDAFFILPSVGLVKSRGHVKLRSANPFDRPDIDPMYFSHPDDFKVMMESVKFALQIGQTEAFRKVGARLTTSLFPGCQKFGNASNDAYWECYVRQLTHTVWHYSGTNRMGKANDPSSVVDSKLRVIGTQNLRVVDASVIPKLTTTNTNLPTIMIGEKGADMIKQAWRGV